MSNTNTNTNINTNATDYTEFIAELRERDNSEATIKSVIKGLEQAKAGKFSTSPPDLDAARAFVESCE